MQEELRKYIKIILSARRYRRYISGFSCINNEIFYIWNGADDFMKSIPDKWWNWK